MSQIQIRPLAQSDLFEIWSYLSQYSEEKANSLIAKFDLKFQLLAQSPQMGRSRPELLIEGLRSFPCDSYIIFYAPISEGIDVIRILHQRRDIEPLLSEPD